MVKYVCENCSRIFKQKGHLKTHQLRKKSCEKNMTLETIIEEKVKEILLKTNAIESKIEQINTQPAVRQMDFTNMNTSELIATCKQRKIKGYSGKKKGDIIKLLQSNEPLQNEIITTTSTTNNLEIRQDIMLGDTIKLLPTLQDNSAQIIIADPPYNIGKDFGNDSDKQPMDEYLAWCDLWIKECLRILKPNGTMFIYGFSEILALILSRVPYNINRRWIIWHYTNKNVALLKFWQRSHESILVLWKDDRVFHRDDIREAYTDGFLNGSAGKERTATGGRFQNKSGKKTTYTAHPNGALPRDVIKIPALAGGAGMNERVNHPTQKPLTLCDKLIRSCRQSPTNGYVLVPFAGSGSECLAAKNLGLPFIGIELNQEYVKLINQRLEGKTQTEEVVPQSESQPTNP